MPDETVSTTYQLSQCLRRRGLAYEFANLISYTAHERYSDMLLRHMTQELPPQYNATSLGQVLRADKAVFQYLMHHATTFRQDANGDRPLDNLLGDALGDYQTSFHLLPLPKLSAAETAYHPKGNKTDYADRGSSAPSGGNYGKGKQRSKGKGKGSNQAPNTFIGCTGKDGKNRPICFDFNLSECQKAAPGGTCNKGRHVCFKAGCFKLHAFKTAHPDEAPKQSE